MVKEMVSSTMLYGVRDGQCAGTKNEKCEYEILKKVGRKSIFDKMRNNICEDWSWLRWEAS